MTTPSSSRSSSSAAVVPDTGVSIVALFSIPGRRTERHVFDASNTEEAVLGLAEGSEPCKPPPGSISYSGVHDHGPMIAPKEGGELARLVGCANAAKKASDKFLTDIIQEEKRSAPKTKADGGGKGEKRKASEEAEA